MKLIIFRIARLIGLFALAKKITAKRVRILCYHAGAISDEDRFNSKLFCSPDLFRARMDWLEKNGYAVVSLSDAIADELPESEAYRWPVVITFDDGWTSTASQLVPILAEKKWPSTLYLCTKYFIEGWPVLNVAVRYVLWKGRLAGNSSCLSHLIPDLPHSLCLSKVVNREILAENIVNWIEATNTNAIDIKNTLEAVGECLGVKGEDIALDSRRFQYMNLSELRFLAAQHCEIALHGHSHIYPTGNFLALKKDIEINREIIRNFGLPYIEHYCYPSGVHDPLSGEWLVECEVVSASVCQPGLFNAKSSQSRYYLPRFLDGGSVENIEFEAEMSGFSDLIRGVVSKIGGKRK